MDGPPPHPTALGLVVVRRVWSSRPCWPRRWSRPRATRTTMACRTTGSGRPRSRTRSRRTRTVMVSATRLEDPDHDTLTNRMEYVAGTNPRRADTDGDRRPGCTRGPGQGRPADRVRVHRRDVTRCGGHGRRRPAGRLREPRQRRPQQPLRAALPDEPAPVRHGRRRLVGRRRAQGRDGSAQRGQPPGRADTDADARPRHRRPSDAHPGPDPDAHPATDATARLGAGPARRPGLHRLPCDERLERPGSTVARSPRTRRRCSRRIGLSTGLHMDFGSYAGYGIPWQVVTSSTPRSTVTFDYDG